MADQNKTGDKPNWLLNNRYVQAATAGVLLAAAAIGLKHNSTSPQSTSAVASATPQASQTPVVAASPTVSEPSARENFYTKVLGDIQRTEDMAKGMPGDEGQILAFKENMFERLANLTKARPDLRLQTLENLRVTISGVTVLPGPAGHQNTQLLLDTASHQLSLYEQGLDKAAQPTR